MLIVIIIRRYNNTDYILKGSNATQNILDIAINEIIASKLYQLAGIKVPNLILVEDTENDKWLIGSERVENYKNCNDKTDPIGEYFNNFDVQKKFCKGYFMDIWLGAWDVKAHCDNYGLITTTNEPIRIDVGGSLLYRAQGSKKTQDEFGSKPIEQYLTGQYAGKGPHLYGDVCHKANAQSSSDCGILMGLDKLKNIQSKINRVDEIIELYGAKISTDTDREYLKNTLKKRLTYLIKNYTKFLPTQYKNLPPTATDTAAKPTPPATTPIAPTPSVTKPVSTESTASPSGSSNIFLKFYGIPDTTTGFESKLRHQQKQNFKINNNHTISETIKAIRNKFTIPNNFNIQLIVLNKIISETDQLSNRISKYNLHSVNHLDVRLIQNKNGPPPVIIPLTTFNDSIFQKNLVDRIVKGLDRKPIKIELNINVDGVDCQNDGDNEDNNDGVNIQKIKFVIGSKKIPLDVNLNKSISDQLSIIIKEFDINNTTANISDDDIIGTKEGDLTEPPTSINIDKPLKDEGITGPDWTIELQIMEDAEEKNDNENNDVDDTNTNNTNGTAPPNIQSIKFHYLVGNQSSKNQDNNVDISAAKIAKQTVTIKSIQINLSDKITTELPKIKLELGIPPNIDNDELGIYTYEKEDLSETDNDKNMDINKSFTTAGVTKNSTIYINYLFKLYYFFIRFE